MPVIKSEGWVPQNKAQESVDKIREIFNNGVSVDLTFGTKDFTQPKQPKRVDDFCRENRCWAAKDSNGLWHSYWSKPVSGLSGWITQGPFDSLENKTEPYFPNVSWDKSLIAPDGRLILIEGKKEKKKKEAKFKIGRWYKHKYTGKVIKYNVPSGNAPIVIEHGGVNSSQYQTKKSDWYEMKHYNPNKKKKDTGLKRGEPVFVWDRYHNSKLPAVVRYFHSDFHSDFDYNGIFTCNESLPNEQGTWYQYYRKFDPRLVGVPRKDWPKL